MEDTHLAAFWDLENIHIPRGCDARLIVEEIRKKVFQRDAFEVSFKAYLDVGKIGEETQRELERANVELVHVPNASKNGADLRIIQSVNDFVRVQGDRKVIVVLLTSDENFLPLASSLRKIRGVQTSLVHAKQTNAALIDAFDRAYLWPDLGCTKGRGLSASTDRKQQDLTVASAKATRPELSDRDKIGSTGAGSKGPRLEAGDKKSDKAPKSDQKMTKAEPGARDKADTPKKAPKPETDNKEKRSASEGTRLQSDKGGKDSLKGQRVDVSDKPKQDLPKFTKQKPNIRAVDEGTARLDLNDRKADSGAKRPPFAGGVVGLPAVEKRRPRHLEAAKPKSAPRKSKEQPKTFTCYQCEKSFDNNEKLLMHQSSTGHVNEHLCVECDRRFSSRAGLVQHQATTGHSNMFECPRCDKEFSSEFALDQHMNDTGHTALFECVECQREFTSEKGLEQHQTSTGHTDGFICGECEKVFGSEQALLMHQESTGHVDGVYCSECDKEFKTQQALDNHQATTGHSDLALL